MQVTSNFWPGAACIHFFQSPFDNRLELKEIPVHGTSKVKMKNSNKTHSLDKNFKWPIALAFSYFAHAPGRTEGQTLWLLLWRLNFILSGDPLLAAWILCYLFYQPALASVNWRIATHTWWTRPLAEEGCVCVCARAHLIYANTKTTLSATIQTIPVHLLFLLDTASITSAWDSRFILVFGGMCHVNGRTDCPWPGIIQEQHAFPIYIISWVLCYWPQFQSWAS